MVRNRPNTTTSARIGDRVLPSGNLAAKIRAGLLRAGSMVESVVDIAKPSFGLGLRLPARLTAVAKPFHFLCFNEMNSLFFLRHLQRGRGNAAYFSSCDHCFQPDRPFMYTYSHTPYGYSDFHGLLLSVLISSSDHRSAFLLVRRTTSLEPTTTIQGSRLSALMDVLNGMNCAILLALHTWCFISAA